MKLSRIGAVWMVAAVTGLVSADFLDFADQIPPCGLQCAMEIIPKSECKSFTNQTCLCTNDPVIARIEACVLDKCNVTDAHKVSRINAEACNKPKRSRTSELLAPLVLEILAMMFLGARFYSRWITIRRFETDDIVMLVTGVLYVPFVIVGHICSFTAFGRDYWWVDDDDLVYALKLFYADEILYVLILALTKISIITFYIHIFPQRSFRVAALCALGMIALSNAVLAFLAIFQCWPINIVWEGWKIYKDHPNPGKCLNVHLLVHVAAGFSIFYDAVLIALPLPLIWRLHASVRAKVGVGLMLSLGVFVLITSCIRLRYLVGFANHRNVTWYYTDPLIWSGVEVAVSVIVTSLPAVRVLVKRSWPTLAGTFPSISMSRRSGEQTHTGVSKRSTTMREKTASSLGTSSPAQRQTSPDSRASLSTLPPRGSGSDWQYGVVLGDNKGIGEPHCGIRSDGNVSDWLTPTPTPTPEEKSGITIDMTTSVEDYAGWRRREDKDMV